MYIQEKTATSHRLSSSSSAAFQTQTPTHKNTMTKGAVRILGSMAAVAAVGAAIAWSGTKLWNRRSTVSSKAIDLKGLKPVSIEVNRFVGEYNEQVRFESRFEKGLGNVTAKYTSRPDGLISVLNSGVKQSNGELVSVKGTARLTKIPGVLLVSFFPLVESPYVVLHASGISADGYDMLVVGSPDRKVLWLLTANSLVTLYQMSTFATVALDNGYTMQQLQQATLVA